jgi:hypothetical protein
MPLFNSQIRRRGVGATVVVELLIVLALGLVFVRYVKWLSDATVAEFTTWQSYPYGGIRHADADRTDPRLGPGPHMGRSSIRMVGPPL